MALNFFFFDNIFDFHLPLCITIGVNNEHTAENSKPLLNTYLPPNRFDNTPPGRWVTM